MSLPEIVNVPLDKIRPNPWRDFVMNPIDNEQVELLRGSINDTKEFWVGVYGRKVTEGFIELAFGHNRLEAAKREGRKSIPIALRELSDKDMLVRMAKENEEGLLSFRIALEAVSAAVKALAKGCLEVPSLPSNLAKERIRYAPSFIAGKATTSEVVAPYSTDTLARVLGGAYIKKGGTANNSVVAALAVLEAMERRVLVGDKVVTPSHFDGRPLTAIASAANQMIKAHVILQETREKTAAEITAYNAKIAEAVRKAEEAEKAEEDARIAKRKADAIAKKDKEDKEAAEAARLAKEELDRREEEAKEAQQDVIVERVNSVAQIQKAEQEVKHAEEKAAYEPVLRDVKSVIGDAGRIAEEHGALWEKVKALKKSAITLPDRDKVMTALREAGSRCDILANLMEVSLKGVVKLPRKSKEKR